MNKTLKNVGMEGNFLSPIKNIYKNTTKATTEAKILNPQLTSCFIVKECKFLLRPGTR